MKRLILGLSLALGCAPAAPSGRPAPSPAAAAAATLQADIVTDLIGQALRADARQEPADSLYAPGALIVADGRRRTGAPRFAGVEPGGEVAIATSRVDYSSAFVWGYVEYRWFSTSANLAREATATVILATLPGRSGWRIVHLHSSTVR